MAEPARMASIQAYVIVSLGRSYGVTVDPLGSGRRLVWLPMDQVTFPPEIQAALDSETEERAWSAVPVTLTAPEWLLTDRGLL